ncbi:NO-binding membrane sensor protein with MHYT domain [Rhizobium mesoamericanum]|nr:NO-binding membrane sensor protein with MHYT domain [Rhizobium mesoamericanum]
MASAFACGVGIWATRFISMLAYDGGFTITSRQCSFCFPISATELPQS